MEENLYKNLSFWTPSDWRLFLWSELNLEGLSDSSIVKNDKEVKKARRRIYTNRNSYQLPSFSTSQDRRPNVTQKRLRCDTLILNGRSLDPLLGSSHFFTLYLPFLRILRFYPTNYSFDENTLDPLHENYLPLFIPVTKMLPSPLSRPHKYVVKDKQ